ncbi:MAG TPA: LuxR C-terminal-related transcriptional regulator [Pseudonocardiaceae bacterium]|jgi:DNA-binding CsgD family transcriptional regulator|nr:LuxR C-terminal-related transcriptional regulator [Pseudonocardiaceae bacterium]
MKRSTPTERPVVPARRRRAELAARARRLLATAQCPVEPADLANTRADLGRLDEALAALAVRLRGESPVAAALADVYALRLEIREFADRERLARSRALDAGLARLRPVRDPDELLDRVCPAVVDSCGFDRVMLSRVEGSVWRPWKSYAGELGDAERSFREWISAVPEIELGSMLLETEMVRRREPALITDPARDRRVYQPMVRAAGLRSYVAAPLMPSGRVIGLLHADYADPVDALVTALDRDILWAFAEEFGRLFERAVLLNRLGEQRERVRAAMRGVESVLEDLASAEIALATRAQASELVAGRAASGLGRSPAGLASLLTGRELEVLSLMATGATNQRIADELVITSGTVKSHVKRILRKLCAENRAQAISQYLRLTIGPT